MGSIPHCGPQNEHMQLVPRTPYPISRLPQGENDHLTLSSVEVNISNAPLPVIVYALITHCLSAGRVFVTL